MINPPTYIHAELDAEQFPELAECYDIWNEKRGDRFAPSWQELDFFAFPVRMIPYLYLIDVQTDPLDFRYRFIGTAICNIEGRDYTGLSVDDIQPPELAPEIRKEFENVYKAQKPVFYMIQEQDYTRSQSAKKIMAGVRLPLSSDGASVDQVVVINRFEQKTQEMKKYIERLITSYE